MSCGNDFVKTLKKIGYPKADELNGEDFDWLFESLEDKSFLEWFCGNVNEEHVVSEKELQDFDNLIQSGKPILEGDALDEVLKTLKPVHSKNSSQKEEEEEEELEDELQTLQQLKKLQTHRHNKLQMMVVANTQMLKISESREQEARKYLKDGLEIFIAANKKLSSELQSLIEAAKKLSSFITASDSEQGSAQHPVFFSQLSLDEYLAQEEQSTAALTSYVKNHKHCYRGMSEWAEKSPEDTFQLGDTSKQVTCVETADVCEEIKEIAMLQTAYVCAQHQRIKMQAKEESMNSALKCAESMLQSSESKEKSKQENLDAKISNLNDEISKIRQDIARISREELLPLLKENAQRFIAPVVKAYMDHQIAQQEYYASRQDEIYRHLIRQKASFELIELGCEMELKKHKEMCCHVENLVESLKQSSIDLQRGIQVVTEQTERAKPRNTISSEDGFSYRLHQLLEGEDNQTLFKTYESLEQMAQQLKQDCARAEDELAASSQEQSLLLSKMKSDVDSVHNALYRGGKQLQLRSPELTDLFNQLEADLKKLNKLLAGLVADVKSKKNFIESNELHQMERNLYVYFFKDEDHLREMVEKLEQQSEAKVSNLEDEKFTTSVILKMEQYASYIACETSKVPLSDTAQRIMTALQSIPVGEVQASRKNNQSTEKTKENKLDYKDAHLKNEKEINDSTLELLKTSASPEKSSAGQLVRTVGSDAMLSCQDTKRVRYYQDLGLPTWEYRERSLSVEAKDLKDGAKNTAVSRKRKQDLPTCSKKARLPLKTYTSSHERRDNCTSGQTESYENYSCDIRTLRCEERRELLATIEQAVAFVTTMIFQDGSSQLSTEQVLSSSVKGVVVLVKNQSDHSCCPSYSSTDCTWNTANEYDKLIYLKTDWPSLWQQEQQAHKKFAWQVLLQMLRCKVPIICFNAKDFLRTLLQVYSNEISWKQVADSIVLDPRIAAWLINPSDTVPSFECLLQKYFEKPFSMGTVNADTGTLRNVSQYQNLGVNLEKLYNVMMDLSHELQVQGLWKLFCTLELPLIKILAVMETHKIHVNKQELKKTSEILGLRLKELEQEAHQVAGERFLLTSSSQLREVLFEKLKLHALCDKVHRTEMQQVASTSEVVLTKLQDLHPLPKIILEYRQVHKMKSTYVDGLRTCMRKGFISSTWNQTGTATGRLSSKRPNIQGISKHPVRITKKQYIKGKEEEILTISPRTLFVSKKGCTFLAADFSHIELRILADLSSEPELLKLFQEPETTDIFSSLASQWKGIPSEQVKHTDREQAKRIVYSVVYGAGKERLADCLGITPLQASQFIESFMQKYKKVHEFTKKTIEQCRNKGYVVSIMGRKRPLANINAQDYKLRTQAERQAVNFVVQGSAADLCKMAMVEIFTSVVDSPTLTARLIAQIHDELLFEVEDSQIQEFSGSLESDSYHWEIMGVYDRAVRCEAVIRDVIQHPCTSLACADSSLNH